MSQQHQQFTPIRGRGAVRDAATVREAGVRAVAIELGLDDDLARRNIARVAESVLRRGQDLRSLDVLVGLQTRQIRRESI